ncbi:MAG: GNAT family N-acetyltransferase, partial [Verrucomicrobia bacterium]|nr:GNAT family N-acetyltransferase [Verrucomicrobiota bacterium]
THCSHFMHCLAQHVSHFSGQAQYLARDVELRQCKPTRNTGRKNWKVTSGFSVLTTFSTLNLAMHEAIPHYKSFTLKYPMQPIYHETPKGTVKLRLATTEDIAVLVELNKKSYPVMAEENVVWTRGHLAAHQKVFPEGQIVAELNGIVVGAVASLIVNLGLNPYRAHTYSGITDGGYFHNHVSDGDTLYGADVYVDPDIRGIGIGSILYEARRNLCKQRNLRRILAGGRLHGYKEHAKQMSPEEYVRAVEIEQIRDLVLSFQLREGLLSEVYCTTT